MRIKSKFELNFVHIAVLAICPLLMMASSLEVGATVMLLTVLSFLFSMLVCLAIAKSSSKNTKVFIAAFVSSLVVAAFELLVKNGTFASIGAASYYSILSTIVLSIDIFYIDTKAKSKNYVVKALRLVFVYALILMFFVSLKELLAFGTIGGFRPFLKYFGYEFFQTIIFDFLLLGLLCALANRVAMTFADWAYQRNMVYSKYKAKVRNEKLFLYEQYRRKKVLTSEVVINKVGGEENEEEDDDDEPLKKKKVRKSVIKNKPRRKNKLRVSKEAKVEKLFQNKAIDKGGNKDA